MKMIDSYISDHLAIVRSRLSTDVTYVDKNLSKVEFVQLKPNLASWVIFMITAYHKLSPLVGLKLEEPRNAVLE